MEIYSNWDNQQEWDSGNFITTGILHHAIRIKQNDIWVCLKSGHPPETQWFTSHSSKSSWFKDPPSLGNPLYLHWHIYRQYMCISKYRFRYIYIHTYVSPWLVNSPCSTVSSARHLAATLRDLLRLGGGVQGATLLRRGARSDAQLLRGTRWERVKLQTKMSILEDVDVVIKGSLVRKLPNCERFSQLAVATSCQPHHH